MTQAFILLQASTQSPVQMMLILGAMILVFWLFMIRPQAKKARQAKEFQQSLQKGAKVVTIAGIHGTIYKVNDDNATIMLETSPGSYMKIEKSAISQECSAALNKPAEVAAK